MSQGAVSCPHLIGPEESGPLLFRKEGQLSFAATSHPRAHQMSQSAAHEQAVGSILEIACVDLLALQELGAAESQILQFVLQFSGIEEQLKGLSIPGHTFGERIERHPLPQVKKLAIDRKIKHNTAARRHSGDHLQRGHTGVAREVRRYPQPGEKRRRVSVESGLLKPIGERLLLEVNGHKGQRLRYWY